MAEIANSPQPVPSHTGTPKRVFSRRFVEPGRIKKALEKLARTRPDIFSELIASLPAVETAARRRIALAG